MAEVVNVNALDYDAIKNKFDVECDNLSKEIVEYIKRMADIKEYVNCELYFHTKRVYLIDSIRKYTDMLIMLENASDSFKSTALNGLVNNANSNFNFKSSQEKMIMIDGNNNVANAKRFIELFNNHIVFLSEIKKTISDVIFNMGKRVEIQKMIEY